MDIKLFMKYGQQPQAGGGIPTDPEIGMTQALQALLLYPAPIRIVVSSAPERLAHLFRYG